MPFSKSYSILRKQTSTRLANEPTKVEQPARRFPPPWSVDELDACFVVRDHSGQALAYLYSRIKRRPPVEAASKVPFSSDTNTDDGGSEDSRRSSDDGSHSGDDGSHSSHKDSGSTALGDILQWADHFEPWLLWLRPPTRPPLDRSVLILS
jgi:hypothetical protein